MNSLAWLWQLLCQHLGALWDLGLRVDKDAIKWTKLLVNTIYLESDPLPAFLPARARVV